MNSHDRPVFRGFDEYKPVRIYHRHMPHWRQDGATYFVTFRLGDSIPKRVIIQWQEEDRVWMMANGINGPLSDPKWKDVYNALTDQTRRTFEKRAAHRLHVELDKSYGDCLLQRPDVRKVIADAFMHFHDIRWWVGDFVIMPNHVHGLFKPSPGYELEDMLGSIKGYTSTQLTNQGIKSGKLWQSENYDHIVRDREELAIWRRYIESNPQQAKLGEKHYTYVRCTWLDYAK